VSFTHPVGTVIFKTLIAEILSWTKPDVCRVDWRRPAIRSPEANDGGVSASRLFGKGRASKQRVPEVSAGADRFAPAKAGTRATGTAKKLIAPPTESLRWPESPSSVRQILLGENVRTNRAATCRPCALLAWSLDLGSRFVTCLESDGARTSNAPVQHGLSRIHAPLRSN